MHKLKRQSYIFSCITLKSNKLTSKMEFSVGKHFNYALSVTCGRLVDDLQTQPTHQLNTVGSRYTSII